MWNRHPSQCAHRGGPRPGRVGAVPRGGYPRRARGPGGRRRGPADPAFIHTRRVNQIDKRRWLLQEDGQPRPFRDIPSYEYDDVAQDIGLKPSRLEGAGLRRALVVDFGGPCGFSVVRVMVPGLEFWWLDQGEIGPRRWSSGGNMCADRSHVVVLHRPQPAPERGRRAAGCDLPPARQARRSDPLLAAKPSAVGIIDGEFYQSLAVSPKEVLALLESGVAVYGAASMGALRAVELHRYGMIGVGSIFRLFRRGVLDADDEVAVTYCGETWRPCRSP